MNDEGWSEPLRPVRPRPRPAAARRWGAPQPSEAEDGSDIRALLGAIGHLQQSVDELRARTEAIERRTASMAAALDAVRRHQVTAVDAGREAPDAFAVDALLAQLSEAVRTAIRDAAAVITPPAKKALPERAPRTAAATAARPTPKTATAARRRTAG